MLNPLNFLSKIIKSSNQKELDKFKRISKKINGLEEEMGKLDDQSFPKKTKELIDKSLNDEVNITVIATGLNDDEYPSYFKREIENTDIKTKNENIPNEENIEKKELIDNEVKDEDDNLLTFGNELDIPTFLRKRNS